MKSLKVKKYEVRSNFFYKSYFDPRRGKRHLVTIIWIVPLDNYRV